MGKSYRHEPFTDFTDKNHQCAFRKALSMVESQLGKEYPLVIGGERITTTEKIVSFNPSQKEEIIGTVSRANQALAEKAMQVALDVFETWKNGIQWNVQRFSFGQQQFFADENMNFLHIW